MKREKNDRISGQYFGALPVWARTIVSTSESVRTSAYWYRREMLALRISLHDLCKDDRRGLEFEDGVLLAKNIVHDRLDEIMSPIDRAERDEIRKRVVREVEAARELLAEHKRGRKAKKVSR